jgi:pantetheine-phosphate adenylyltransferase
MSISKKIALFPGSFDPFTIGHYDIVERALSFFDEIIVAIGSNSTKSGFFTIEDRVKWIEKAFENEPRVRVEVYGGLTVDYCNKLGAEFLLRGLRTSSDFEYERAIAQMNKKMSPHLESVFLLTRPEHTPISSTIVRELYRNGGDIKEFLPKGVIIDS